MYYRARNPQCAEKIQRANRKDAVACSEVASGQVADAWQGADLQGLGQGHTSERRDIRAIMEKGSSLSSKFKSFVVTEISHLTEHFKLVSWLQEGSHLLLKQSVGDSGPAFE